MKINDKELSEVSGGFSESTSVVYTLETGDCFKCAGTFRIYYIPRTYSNVGPNATISVEKYQFDSERNVYKYIGNSNGLFVYNVIGDGYLGKLTNLVRD